MIDTHAHINFSVYDEDREAMLQRAWDAGVSHIVIPGTTLETCASAIALAHKHERVYAGAGIHPTDVADVSEEDLRRLEVLLQKPKVVALGEVGLDFYHDASLANKQEELLEKFFTLGQKYNKPLIIHNRNSQEAMTALLKRLTLPTKPGVFHCFAGDKTFARTVLDHGFYVSFAGVVTFKNAKDLQEVVAYVPLDRVLIETDSPYLTPHPHRGQRNEPAYVRLVLEKVAELQGRCVDEVDKVTTQNACRLFNIVQRQ